MILCSRKPRLSIFSPQPILANAFREKAATDSELNYERSPLFGISVLLVLPAFATPDDVCNLFWLHRFFLNLLFQKSIEML